MSGVSVKYLTVPGLPEQRYSDFTCCEVSMFWDPIHTLHRPQQESLDAQPHTHTHVHTHLSSYKFQIEFTIPPHE